jgi:hypothetical protein
MRNVSYFVKAVDLLNHLRCRRFLETKILRCNIDCILLKQTVWKNWDAKNTYTNYLKMIRLSHEELLLFIFIDKNRIYKVNI